MCTPKFQEHASFVLTEMKFSFKKDGAVSTFEIDSGSVVSTIAIPTFGEARIAMRVSGTNLSIGSLTTEDCEFKSSDIPLSAGLSTFTILPNGDGIGITDLRDGRVALLDVDLRSTPILCSLKRAGADTLLHLEYLAVNEDGRLNGEGMITI